MAPAKSTSGKSEDPKKAGDPTPAPSTAPSDDKAAVPTQAVPNHDDTDVAAALERKTQDGKGSDEIAPSNFKSFATDNVERDKSNLDIAHEVLEGKWGFSRATAFTKLREANLDVYAIDDEVRRLLDSGKPSTLSD